MKFVYILQSLDGGHFYAGMTDDVPARLAKHNAGEVPHTSKFRPWKIKPTLHSQTRSRRSPSRNTLSPGQAALSQRSACEGRSLRELRLGKPGYIFSIVIPGRASARTMMRNCASENPFLQTSCGAMDSGPAPIGASRNVDVIFP
jgi:GIY-YIG catalytic domain